MNTVDIDRMRARLSAAYMRCIDLGNRLMLEWAVEWERRNTYSINIAPGANVASKRQTASKEPA